MPFTSVYYGVCVGELGCDRVGEGLFADVDKSFVLDKIDGLAQRVGLRFVLINEVNHSEYDCDDVHYFDVSGNELEGACEGALRAYRADFVYVGRCVPSSNLRDCFCTFDEKCVNKLIRDYKKLLKKLGLVGLRARKGNLKFFVLSYNDY